MLLALLLAATSTTLQACTGCHEAWRQEIVSPEAWSRLTGAAAPAHGDPGHP